MTPDGAQQIAQMATMQANVTQTQLDIHEVKGDVKEIKKSLETMTDGFITRGEFSEFKHNLWQSRVMTIVATAIITGLAYWFIASSLGLK